MKTLVLVICSIFLTACNSSKLEKVSFLVATWQIEGKQSFESWKKTGDSLQGSSYKLIADEKKVSETLSISVINDKIIYAATVLNQNDGKTIPFTLNLTEEGKFSFENLGHDFPKKIQYTVLSNDTLFVNVLGDNDQGFSYKLIRQ